MVRFSRVHSLRAARLAAFLLSIVGIVLGSPGAVRAGEVTYSSLDLSTVRVFAVGGVQVTTAENKETGRKYQLGIPEVGHGSGLRITDDGLVLTARHVVEGARQVVVRTPGSKEAFAARVLYVDDREDFAFITVGAPTGPFIALPVAAPSLKIRQTVFAVGYPFDASKLRPQSTRGVISGLEESHLYSLGISVNPGNSGGPLVDESEQVLGVVVARGDPRKGAQGIGYANALDRVLAVLPQIVERHKRARAALGAVSPAEKTFAQLIARLAEGEGAAGMLEDARRALSKLKQTGLAKDMAAALAAKDVEADALAMGCAYHWNAAVVARILKEPDWNTSFNQSKTLCERAAAADKEVLKRSPFVQFVIGGNPAASVSPVAVWGRAPKSEPPRSVAGFSYTDDVAAVQKICTAAKLKLTGVKAEGLRCSGAPVDVGYPTPVRLRFCGDQVCRIELLTKLEGDDPSAWLAAFEARKKELEAAYGPPTRDQHDMKPDCTESLSWCLANQKATLESEWYWPVQSTSIWVRLERSEHRGLVRVGYQRR